MFDLRYSYRMSLNSFEKHFISEFKRFAFNQAIQVASDMLARQDEYTIRTKLAKVFANNRMTDRKNHQDLGQFIQQNIKKISIETMLETMKDISKNPSQFRTPPVDASLAVWIHGGRVYVAAINHFADKFEKPQNCESFNPSDSAINWQRKPVWDKVLAESTPMIMTIIKPDQNIGMEQIQNHIENNQPITTAA
jgi:hypothetical protein